MFRQAGKVNFSSACNKTNSINNMASRVNRVDLASLNRGGQLLGVRERSRSPPPPPPAEQEIALDVRVECKALKAKLRMIPIKVPPYVLEIITAIEDAPDHEVVMKMRDLSWILKMQLLRSLTIYCDGMDQLSKKLNE